MGDLGGKISSKRFLIISNISFGKLYIFL